MYFLILFSLPFAIYMSEILECLFFSYSYFFKSLLCCEKDIPSFYRILLYWLSTEKILCLLQKSLFSLSAPFILWKSIPFFYGNVPFILWKCSLYTMEISLYSMEKLSHPACSKGSRLRKRLFKTILKYFKGEAVLSDADFCRLTRRNLLLLTAGAKKPNMLFAITGRLPILM